MIWNVSKRIEQLENARYESAPGFTMLFTYIDANGKLMEDISLELSPFNRKPTDREAKVEKADGGIPWQG
jgi:hypothetical protein